MGSQHDRDRQILLPNSPGAVIMLAANLLRLSSQLLQLLGWFAVFCLYYAALIPDIATSLLLQAALCGGLAATIVYFHGKYLANV
jgi:hypothetical protein